MTTVFNADPRSNGINPNTGLYMTRYYARKAARGHQVTVKVDGGYANMEPDQYRTWRAQK